MSRGFLCLSYFNPLTDDQSSKKVKDVNIVYPLGVGNNLTHGGNINDEAWFLATKIVRSINSIISEDKKGGNNAPTLCRELDEGRKAERNNPPLRSIIVVKGNEKLMTGL